MKKGAATKQRIIESATELIHKHGMNVVSVGDVLNASGTGKSQFYSHFKSRDDLISSVLKNNAERICAALSEPLKTWADVQNWIFVHLEFQKSYGFERGCPFGTAANALHADQEHERVPLQKILNTMRDRLVRFFVKQKEMGLLPEGASSDRLASFTVASIQGALMIGLVEKNDGGASDALKECWAHLESFRLDKPAV